jgi:hypothetical protein
VRTEAGHPVVPRPVFSSFETSYTATVTGDVRKIVLTPTAYDPRHKRITINGAPVASGAALTADLDDAGRSRFDIAVTAANDSVRTYSIEIRRAPPAAN